MKRAKTNTIETNKNNYKLGISLLILIVIMVGIAWLAWPAPARSTEEVAQRYMDLLIAGDAAGANRLTQFDTACSAPAPYLENEIAKQTAVFTQTTIRNLTIQTHPADPATYPQTAETADIYFEYQTITKGPWQPTYLWLITIPNSNSKAICHLGGSSQWAPE